MSSAPLSARAVELGEAAASVAECAARLRALAARLRADPAAPAWLAAALDAHLTACTIAAHHLAESSALLISHTAQQPCKPLNLRRLLRLNPATAGEKKASAGASSDARAASLWGRPGKPCRGSRDGTRCADVR
ncbi:hypothetical protein [Actinocorallia sp. A-T 12471]|uniref:hypothetical protein n=1 Tax=Actinocorallia sp. A-T 12471 TaxID=3089813 RepID=UPI0029D01CF0|nr:hypothetical protein [Actinocorallia sp. A-T 12471]MDX6741254.1 hypothetical protein [Actinocorallia sp. A-T 12471]